MRVEDMVLMAGIRRDTLSRVASTWMMMMMMLMLLFLLLLLLLLLLRLV